MKECVDLDEEIQTKNREIDDLRKRRNDINNKNDIRESIAQVIWEQFILMLCGNARSEFYKENSNLNLSLKKADHYLDPDNFEKGKYPTHNDKFLDSYIERYNDASSRFTDNSRTKLAEGYRDDFDASRPHGTTNEHLDHTIPVKEILLDEEATAYLTEEELKQFANSDINLKPLDAAANQSKGDLSMDEWLNSKDKNGLSPSDKYNLDEDSLHQRDKNARDAYAELKEDGRERAINEGHSSMRDEAFLAAEVTTNVIFMALLAKLFRDIFNEIMVWILEKKKNKTGLLKHIKKGFRYFIQDYKTNLGLSIDVGLTTILSMVYDDIIIAIRKVLFSAKIISKTFKDIKKYYKDPKNKEKDDYIKIIEMEKIAVNGCIKLGSIALSEFIKSILEKIYPLSKSPLPIIGSPSQVIGLFIGCLMSGVVGVIACNKLDKALIARQVEITVQKEKKILNEISVLHEKKNYIVLDELYQKRNATIKEMIEDLSSAYEEYDRISEEDNVIENSENMKKLDEILKKLNK